MNINIFSIFILAAVIVNVLLFRMHFTRIRESRALKYYLWIIIILFAWQTFELLALVVSYKNYSLYFWRISSSISVYIGLYMFLFIAAFLRLNIKRGYVYIFHILGLFFSLITLFTNGIIKSTTQPYFWGTHFIVGQYYIYYTLFIVIFFTLTFYFLTKKYLEANDKKYRSAVLFLLIGLFITSLVGTITNLILPILKINFMPLGGIFGTVMAALISIAIYKFQFSDIRPKRLTIRGKLVFIYISIIIFAVFTFGFISFKYGSEAIKERVFTQLESVAVLKESQFNYFIERERDSLEGLAGSEYFSRLVSNYLGLDLSFTSASSSRGEEVIGGLLQEYLEHGNFVELFVIDRTGLIAYSTSKTQIGKIKDNEEYFFEGLKRAYISNFYYDISSGRPIIVISVPIIDNKTNLLKAVLAGQIDLNKTSDLMVERGGLGETGETYLVNKFNFVVSELKKEPDAVLKKAIYTDGVKECLSVNSGQGRYSNYAGDIVLGYYKYISEREVCLLAEINESEAFQPIVQLGQIIILIGLLIMLAALVLILFFARAITRPIIDLNKVMKKFGQGNLAVRPRIRSRDEVGELAGVFTTMSEKLITAQSGLEMKVQEKTKELESLLKSAQKDRAELDTQRLATLNILEDVSDSQKEVEEVNAELKNRSKDLESLKKLGDELSGAFDIDEAVIIINKFLNNTIGCSVSTYLIISPIKDDEIIYSALLNKEISENYLDEIKTDLDIFTALKENRGLLGAKKIIENIRPRLIGKKLNNSAKGKIGSRIIYPLYSGDDILGVIHISSTEKRLYEKGRRELIDAMVSSFSMSVSRLHSLISSQHSKTVSLVESLSDGVVMFDVKQDVLLVNPAITKFTGLSRSGFTISALTSLFSTVKLDELIYRVLREGQSSFIGEVPLSDSYYFELLIMPIKDSQSKIVGGAIIIHDVTHLKEIDKMKTEFVSVASHQLRTPLTAIKLYTEMIINGDVGKINKDQHDYLDNIYESTERMVRLVNDLLSLSRLESGKLRIEPVPVKLDDFIANIVKDVTPLAITKNVKISFDPKDKDLPAIPLDPNLMRQVVNNLITNAVRYSAGKGKVEIDLIKDKKDYLISIKDNGIGIPKKVQAKIFEKFYRADNAVKSETEGTGLGLYVSKMIVEGSGGRIWFESIEGKGTTFKMTLPIKGMVKRKGDKKLPGDINAVSYS